MPDRIRVLIVDDHPVVRQGLRAFLELQDDIEIVGEAGDIKEAVGMLEAISPDLLLLDNIMPDLEKFDFIDTLRKRGFLGSVVTVKINSSLATDSSQRQAKGIAQNAEFDGVVKAIRQVPKAGFIFGVAAPGPPHGDEEASGLEQPLTYFLPGTIVELVVPSTVKPGILINLHKWVTDVAHAELESTGTSLRGEVVLAVRLKERAPFLQLLAEFPDVEEVNQERANPPRFRLVMKEPS